MNLITQLESLGYSFTLEGDKLRYTHTGQTPDPATAGPLLAELKERRLEAIRFLRCRHALRVTLPIDEFFDYCHANGLEIVPGSLCWTQSPDDPFKQVATIGIRARGEVSPLDK